MFLDIQKFCYWTQIPSPIPQKWLSIFESKLKNTDSWAQLPENPEQILLFPVPFDWKPLKNMGRGAGGGRGGAQGRVESGLGQ